MAKKLLLQMQLSWSVPGLCAFGGQDSKRPSSHGDESSASENQPRPHGSHSPAEALPAPTRPLPAGHDTCSPHSLVSSASFQSLVMMPQTSHVASRSDGASARPRPGLQFRHGVHWLKPTSSLEYWPTGHSVHSTTFLNEDVPEVCE